MTISSVTDYQNATATTYAEQLKANGPNNTINQDSFLRLFMAQLQNQDPTNPTDTSQFLGQQAQISQVSELQKLNQTIMNSNQIMQSSNLIGKEVTIENPDDATKTITGTVTEAQVSVNNSNNVTGTSIVINDVSYPINLIRSVK